MTRGEEGNAELVSREVSKERKRQKMIRKGNRGMTERIKTKNQSEGQEEKRKMTENIKSFLLKANKKKML